VFRLPWFFHLRDILLAWYRIPPTLRPDNATKTVLFMTEDRDMYGCSHYYGKSKSIAAESEDTSWWMFPSFLDATQKVRMHRTDHVRHVAEVHCENRYPCTARSHSDQQCCRMGSHGATHS
jgi:hypothetical protein